MKTKPSILLVPLIFLASIGRGQEVSDIQSFDLTAATGTFQAKKLVVDNMRIVSDTTRASDYIRGTFKFSKATQSFVPKSFQIFQNVGVFHNGTSNDDYFANDALEQVVFSDATGRIYGEAGSYSITTSGAPFSAGLAVGQVISFTFTNNTDDMRVVFRGPDGTTYYDELIPAQSGIISGTTPIIQGGVYTLTFTPVNQSQVSLKLSFGNANRQQLTTLQSGAQIQTHFRQNLHDYYKYKIHLNGGDVLSVTAPASSDTHLDLVNSESKVIDGAFGLALLYTAPVTEDYYLFIDDRTAHGTNYSGSISISSGGSGSAISPGTHTGYRRSLPVTTATGKETIKIP